MILYRHSIESDSPGIVALLQSAGLPSDDFTLSECVSVLAEEGGKVVGHAAVEVHGKTGLLRSVVVDTEFRNYGVAAELVGRVLSEAGDRGVTTVYLLTETAQKYFARHGFVVTDRNEVPTAIEQTSEFKDVCPTSAILMRKNLGQD